jgi:UDPglucose 6-dehydrogenase
VLGTGYLGVTQAACLADQGFEVLGVDRDRQLVAALNAGRPPCYEPGLVPLLARGLGSGRLRFGPSYQQAAAFGDVHFICVGTPQQRGGRQSDPSQLHECVNELAPLLSRAALLVGKSTAPVGTAVALAGRVAALAPAGPAAELAWNPEFLREGHAVQDTLGPDRIVAGVTSGHAETVLHGIYADQLGRGVPFLVTDPTTAELSKMAANSFLAMKISFINAMAEVCDASGADVIALARAMALDDRIGGGSLRPGLGFGGGCLPKDLRAFAACAEGLGCPESLSFLPQVETINLRSRQRVVELTRELAGGSVAGRRLCVLGAAFKPDSDDIRQSPDSGRRKAAGWKYYAPGRLAA